MRTITKSLLAASVLAVLGTSGAQASIIGPDVAGGSEAILTLVNSTTSQTVAQDLGVQWGQITATSYALSSTLQNFITAAGVTILPSPTTRGRTASPAHSGRSRKAAMACRLGTGVLASAVAPGSR